MLNWLKKLFGYHVCGPFTKWEVKTENWIHCPYGMQSLEHKYTVVYQERRCIECGKTFRKEL